MSEEKKNELQKSDAAEGSAGEQDGMSLKSRIVLLAGAFVLAVLVVIIFYIVFKLLMLGITIGLALFLAAFIKVKMSEKRNEED